LGKCAEIIGEVTDNNKDMVILKTVTGGRRILDIPSGLQLPRIC
jgi:hydrogenase expression/formation protein HypE